MGYRNQYSEVLPRLSLPLQRLSGRKLVTLHLMCKGLRNHEIAAQLGVSTRSVKAYNAQLFVLFDVTNRTELVGIIGDEIRAEIEAKIAQNRSILSKSAVPLGIYNNGR